ncbi:hypothetical protein OIE65_46035 [Streptomyces sp. NBC_01800]|nr:hypothetical protein OIE65_00025 [Streptomyces sp. NBC_01800]WSA73556.1 hypothetical protein OIE65_46035 [Streptomyces sp. NBC_01800]
MAESTLSNTLKGKSAPLEHGFNVILDALFPETKAAVSVGRPLPPQEAERHAQQRTARHRLTELWGDASRRQPRRQGARTPVDSPDGAPGTTGEVSVRSASAADAAVHAAAVIAQIREQREAVGAFDKAATDVLRDAQEAFGAGAGLRGCWPDVEDALNTLARTGPEDVMKDVLKAARSVHLLLGLLPQLAACCAAISHLDADERAALDRIATAVRWADGDINAHVRLAEERAHEALESVQRRGGGFLTVHLLEGLFLQDMGPRYQRAIGVADVALREFRSLVRRRLFEPNTVHVGHFPPGGHITAAAPGTGAHGGLSQ